MWKRLIAMSLTFGLAATAPPALAQTPCGAHEAIIAKLTTIYEETRIGRGLQSPTSLFEVWRSNENGNWTILKLQPDGTACVVATGFAWTDEKNGTKSVQTVLRR